MAASNGALLASLRQPEGVVREAWPARRPSEPTRPATGPISAFAGMAAPLATQWALTAAAAVVTGS